MIASLTRENCCDGCELPNICYSVRVSNELGSGNARAAKFAVVVVCVTSVTIGVVCMALILITRDNFPYLFTSSSDVAKEVSKLATLLGITMLLNSLQPVLSGIFKKIWVLCVSIENIRERRGTKTFMKEGRNKPNLITSKPSFS